MIIKQCSPSANLLEVCAEAVPEEPLEAVLAGEVLDHPGLGPLVQRRVVGGEGRVGDGGQQGDVRVLRVGLPRQEGLEDAPVPVVSVDVGVDDALARAPLAEQVKPIHSLRGGGGGGGWEEQRCKPQ